MNPHQGTLSMTTEQVKLKPCPLSDDERATISPSPEPGEVQ